MRKEGSRSQECGEAGEGCCGETIQLIFSTQGYGRYCFSVRPKARTGKFIEKGNEEIAKRHLPFLNSFPYGGLYTSLPPYRAPVGVEYGRPYGPKKRKNSKGAPLMFLEEILGHGIWMGKICRHVANDRQEKEYGAIIHTGQARPIYTRQAASRSTYLAKPIQNI